jgi:hypothetical protein
MNGMIAFCGIDCQDCGARLATMNDDDEKRKEVAVLWSKEHDTDLKPEDINCEGCTTENGILFGYCKVCEIRRCAVSKDVQNCGYCVDYPCDKLDTIFEMVPEAELRLDLIARAL